MCNLLSALLSALPCVAIAATVKGQSIMSAACPDKCGDLACFQKCALATVNLWYDALTSAYAHHKCCAACLAPRCLVIATPDQRNPLGWSWLLGPAMGMAFPQTARGVPAAHLFWAVVAVDALPLCMQALGALSAGR
jgi:hypothetical protein